MVTVSEVTAENYTLVPSSGGFLILAKSHNSDHGGFFFFFHFVIFLGKIVIFTITTRIKLHFL